MMESASWSRQAELDRKKSEQWAQVWRLVSLPFVRLCVLVDNSLSHHELAGVEFVVEVGRTKSLAQDHACDTVIRPERKLAPRRLPTLSEMLSGNHERLERTTA